MCIARERARKRVKRTPMLGKNKAQNVEHSRCIVQHIDVIFVSFALNDTRERWQATASVTL